MTEKLQKILSRAGIASRRALEQMIEEGRILVDGKVATIGDRFEADAISVKIDGRLVLSPQSEGAGCRVLMYHKPEGELTTLSDPENRPTVFDHLPKPPSGRWIYIGRLDINTSGLLLFTTDGELANALMHPKYEVERIYAARVYGEVSEEIIDKLTQGVMLEDGKARFNRVTYVGGEGRNSWYHVSLKEGRKREVRRLWEAVGLKVSRLIRIKYAGVELDPALKTGQYRELSLVEINKLRKTVKLDPIESAPTPLETKTTTKFKKVVKKDKVADKNAAPKKGADKKSAYIKGEKDHGKDFKRGFKKTSDKSFGKKFSKSVESSQGKSGKSFVKVKERKVEGKGKNFSQVKVKATGQIKGQVVKKVRVWSSR